MRKHYKFIVELYRFRTCGDLVDREGHLLDQSHPLPVRFDIARECALHLTGHERDRTVGKAHLTKCLLTLVLMTLCLKPKEH